MKVTSFQFRLFFILLVYPFCEYYCKGYSQERAVIKYYNPKYVSTPQALTARGGRGKPYRSNLTATTKHAWANNVTFKVTYKLDGTDFTWKIKSCAITHVDWLMEYLKDYSNIPVKCPVPPGFYGFFNLELPPKNFPLPIPKGNTYVNFGFHLTDTMDALLEVGLLFVNIK